MINFFRYLFGVTIVGLSLLFYIFFAQNVANENNFGETYENFERSTKNDIIFSSRNEKNQRKGEYNQSNFEPTDNENTDASTNLITKNNVAISTKPSESPDNEVIFFQINHGTYDWI